MTPTRTSDPDPIEEADEMRLDDLAAAAGVATTTIRLYRQRGLLPAPRLVGRTGWYGRAHLARLRLIARLQEQGFSLAGIGKLVESWEQGRDLTDLVEAEAQVGALLDRRTETIVEPAALAARFPPESLTPALLRQAVDLGLAEPTDDGRLRIPDDRFLDIGADLAALGLPLDVVLAEWAALRTHTDEIATRFVAVFEKHLVPEGMPERLQPETANELAATLGELQRHAGRVTLTALDTSMAAAVADRLGTLLSGD